MSRLLALSLALLLAACSASSKSSKKPASADSEFKEWGSEKSSSSSKDEESKADESKADEEEESEFKDPKKEKLPEGPNCLDQKGDVMECIHDSDCCRGFYCGIDPSGSPRIKVCLYGGK